MIKLQLVREDQEPIVVEVHDEIQEAAFINQGFERVEKEPKKKK